MRIEISKCDACKNKIGEGDRSRDRAFELRTPFTSVVEFDICRDCWQKMCAAVGLDPTLDIKDPNAH